MKKKPPDMTLFQFIQIVLRDKNDRPEKAYCHRVRDLLRYEYPRSGSARKHLFDRGQNSDDTGVFDLSHPFFNFVNGYRSQGQTEEHKNDAYPPNQAEHIDDFDGDRAVPDRTCILGVFDLVSG